MTRERTAMKVLIATILFFAGIFVTRAALADVQASFEGSTYPAMDCNTVFSYRDQIDGAGNWIDSSYSLLPICPGKVDLPVSPTGGPITVFSDLQMSDGNRMTGRVFDGATQWYSRADSDSFDPSGSFTLSFVLNADEVTTQQSAIAKDAPGVGATSRGYDVVILSGSIYFYIFNSTGYSVVAGSITANTTHVYQAIYTYVADGTSVLALYSDGILLQQITNAIGPVRNSVSDFCLGARKDPGVEYPFNGQISFAQLDARAKPAAELKDDLARLQGLYGSTAGQNWTFTRSTAATKSLNAGPSSLSTVAANVPRVGDGVLIEGAVTQLHGLTEAFDSWGNTGGCAVTANAAIAPDGTMTADFLDNTGGASSDYRYFSISGLGDMTGRSITQSVWVWSITPHIVTLQQYAGSEGSVIQSVFVEAGPQRISSTHTYTTATAGTIEIGVFPGEKNVATGTAYFWGANLTETKFMTSYIPNAGAAATQVTKTADNLSIPLHQAGTNKDLLPYLFGPLPNQANKLTIEFDMKAEWSSSADSPVAWALDITTPAGRIQYYNWSNGMCYFEIPGGPYKTSAANVVDYSKWHRYKYFLDFSDLSRSYASIDGVNFASSTAGWTGTLSLDTTGGTLNVLQNNGSGLQYYGTIKNLRISPSEW
jgi:hypothetical protein